MDDAQETVPLAALIACSAKDGEHIKELAEQSGFQTIPLDTPDELQQMLQQRGKKAPDVVVVHMGRAIADARFFERLRSEHSCTRVILLSNRTFHPELKQALSTNIFAILSLPLDEDELLYCLRSLREAWLCAGSREGDLPSLE